MTSDLWILLCSSQTCHQMTTRRVWFSTCGRTAGGLWVCWRGTCLGKWTLQDRYNCRDVVETNYECNVSFWYTPSYVLMSELCVVTLSEILRGCMSCSYSIVANTCHVMWLTEGGTGGMKSQVYVAMTMLTLPCTHSYFGTTTTGSWIWYFNGLMWLNVSHYV